ncbi:hypothetical protein K469DRAFT_278173 [Zopfia rhizophila CBS 207.26]|uniref:Uncharacterized protein n=1 Tax=Zopfia rhizophila CBS 207.26 TaxID=1314779 RepID=A0A6A6DLN2_9PEZI|nr:hypothetical protein K469DRAFT_278173 [Zopfia rhizophila CBS 207.26]
MLLATVHTTTTVYHPNQFSQIISTSNIQSYSFIIPRVRVITIFAQTLNLSTTEWLAGRRKILICREHTFLKRLDQNTHTHPSHFIPAQPSTNIYIPHPRERLPPMSALQTTTANGSVGTSPPHPHEARNPEFLPSTTSSPISSPPCRTQPPLWTNF